MVRTQHILLALTLAERVVSQAAGWMPDQVNTTLCFWDSPRAGVIRDTLYIDGGYQWWLPGLKDESYGAPINDGNPLGLVYLLNFSTPFNTTGTFNLSTAFTTISKAAGGGNANNIGPLYLDGAMFANDDEWITYGGLTKFTDAYKPQDGDSIAAYQAYQYGPVRSQFQPGYALQSLTNGVTRYISNGAGVSIPSENLGFYFSGLRSASKGPIYYQPGTRNASQMANYTSNTLISVDMRTQGQEKWSNVTLPTTVPGRANAELVWVPVSNRGILVAIGGVINPSFATPFQKNNAAAADQSSKISPTFMTTVSVYDIENKVWYEQNTTGTGPGQLTQGCTVLASAQDDSSHNIYWYGGFDGLDPTGTFSDDVYVLSIPTFTWVKVKSGTGSHGRAGHKCVKPYPDQMIVVGGYASLTGQQPSCVEGGVLQIFNLSSTLWLDNYSPEIWSNYTVPASVIAAIGGTATGGSTQTAPATTGFSNTSMTALFGTKYNTSKIAQWYPYDLQTKDDVNHTNPLLPSAVPKPGSGGTPSYLAPVLGVVLGLIFISLLVLAFVLWRKRKYFKARTATQSESGTMDNERWVTNWLRKTPVVADEKAPTVTTDETHTTLQGYEDEPAFVLPEVEGRQVMEMEDTSRPTELAGFVPLSQNHRPHRTGSQNSYSHASEVSSDSPRPGISPVATPHPDSPPVGELPENSTRLYSDISVVSDSDRGHLRGISETSVSTDGAFATPMETPRNRGLGIQERGVSPLPDRGVSPVPNNRTVSPVPPPVPVSEEQRLGIVSPLTPGAPLSGAPFGVATARGLAAPGSPSPSQRRKSQFEENLGEDK